MISEFRRRKYSALFNHLDNNRDGLIDLTDWDRYAEIMRKEMGWPKEEPRLASLIETTNQWWSIMRDAMGASDKGITREQLVGFLDGMAEQARAGAPPPRWAIDLCTKTHRLLDTTGSGTVDAQEYGLWLRSIGSKANPAEVFPRLDLNGDGVVELDEMMVLFAQFVMSEDPAEPGNYLMTGTF